MQKIPTVFQRDPAKQFRVVPILTAGCEWVKTDVTGSGFCTIKIDGICVKWEQQQLFRRLKPANGQGDAAYIKVLPTDTDYEVLQEALENAKKESNTTWLQDGIYEAYGPKILGNHQQVARHSMIRVNPVDCHLISGTYQSGIERFTNTSVERFFETVRQALEDSPTIEGLVFHQEAMGKLVKAAKIKRKDFGFEWPVVKATTDLVVPEKPESPAPTVANSSYDYEM